MIKRGKEEFAGYNKPKRTPGHPTKSHAVLAKDGDEETLGLMEGDVVSIVGLMEGEVVCRLLLTRP